MRGSMMDGEIEFAYVDGSAGGAPYVELARIGPQMQEFYDAVKEQAAMSRVALVTGVAAGSLGEATAAALRDLGLPGPHHHPDAARSARTPTRSSSPRGSR